MWNLARPQIVPADVDLVQFAIDLQPGQQFPIDTGLPVAVAISPEGDQIVYAARDASGDRLFRRRRDDLEASPISGPG